jgi:hypothetical protein
MAITDWCWGFVGGKTLTVSGVGAERNTQDFCAGVVGVDVKADIW